MSFNPASAAAWLSAWVYRSDSISSAPPGFTALGLAPPNGLAAAAYQSKATGQIFVVARGTTSDPTDWLADAGIVSGELPSVVGGLVNITPVGMAAKALGTAQFDKR